MKYLFIQQHHTVGIHLPRHQFPTLVDGLHSCDLWLAYFIDAFCDGLAISRWEPSDYNACVDEDLKQSKTYQVALVARWAFDAALIALACSVVYAVVVGSALLVGPSETMVTVVLVLFGCVVATLLIRVVIVACSFMQYSLRRMLGYVLLYGFLIAMLVATWNAFTLIAASALIVVGGDQVRTILKNDPTRKKRAGRTQD